MTITAIVLFIICFTCCASANLLNQTAVAVQSYGFFKQSEYKFEHQKLDHFDLTSKKTWSMRYFVVDDYFKDPNSPIIYNLCGEYTCPGVNPERLFPVQLAQEYGAMIVSVEHRFYGESQPTGDATLDSLRLLNSRQALNDFAYFQQAFQQDLNTKYGKTTNNKWIALGGSYPGALAAWYRLKYPHLVVGALASSAVVDAFVEMPEFDEQVNRATVGACANALRQATKQVEAKMPGIKAAFRAQDLRDSDFYFLLADIPATSVQYGHRKALCDSMALTKQGDYAAALANYSTTYYYDVLGNNPKDYDMQLLVSTQVNNMRSWWWQTCAEFGWYQIAPQKDSIRSQKVNMAWYRDVCKLLYGLTTDPDTEATNNYYGGLDIASSNILFTNGIEDPWQWASVRTSTDPSQPARISECEECGHCVELYTPTDKDSQALRDTRQLVRKYFTKWLSA